MQSWVPKEIKEKCCNFLFKKYVKCDETKFSKELYLTKKEIKEMIKNGMFFGGHGYRHIRLGELDYSNQKKEIDKMVKFLKTCDIKKNWVMCYPYGSYNKDTVSILSKKKCIMSFSASSGRSFLIKKNLFNMNRFDTNDICKKF